MKISTKGRYALRIMLDLAFHSAGDLVPLKDIARRQDITVKYMEQIISPLSKAGLVISLRGSSGGYRLARAPKDYTCGDILRVVEGPLVPTESFSGSGAAVGGQSAEESATLEFWKGLSRVINEYVDSVTLEDLMNRQLALVTDYVI